MVRIGLAVLLAMIGAAEVVGQPHPRWGFVAYGGAPISRSFLGTVDRSGVMTTLRTNATQILDAATMALDNRLYAAVALDYALLPYHVTLLRIDPSGFIFDTLYSSMTHVGSLKQRDLALDQDGNYVLLDCGTLLRVDRQRNVTTLARPNRGTDLTIDLDTGDFIVSGTTRSGSSLTYVYRVPSTGQTVTTMAILGGAAHQSGRSCQEILSGDFFLGCSYSSLLPAIWRMTQSGKNQTFAQTVASSQSARSLSMDRCSIVRPALAVATISPGNHVICLVDVKTQAVTRILTSNPMSGFDCLDLFPDRFRNAATLKQGPGQWAVPVSFPGEGGQIYGIGLSASGVRPGVALADGRRIAFNLDGLTVLGLTGRLHPMFRQWTGRLDSVGRATAFLDVSSLPGVRGLRVWIQAMTIDPSATLGIRTIADPIGLTF